MTKKLTTEEFIDKARLVHGTRYDYSRVEYIQSKIPVAISCYEHGQFHQTPNTHLTGAGCPLCGVDTSNNSKRLTTKSFLDKATAVHGNRYDYSRVQYITHNQKVTIVCTTHGDFQQTPAAHLIGQGCPDCGRHTTTSARKMSTADFIEKAKLLHGERYDYSSVEYTSSATPVTIICPDHGEFSQIPNSHLNGRGCQSCANSKHSYRLRLTTSSFIHRARSVHDDRYDYSLINYKSSKDKVVIICPEHGEFRQAPDMHIQGQGCPMCFSNISKSGTAWLDYLGLPNTPEHREVAGLIHDRLYVVDGFDPITKTVYEFHGDYWHGNPNKFDPDKINPNVGRRFGDLYEDTMIKRTVFEMAGFNYVEIWESEWNQIVLDESS